MANQYSGPTQRQYDILLIEPEPEAAQPFIDSFRTTDTTETVHVVDDGDEALAYIHGEPPYADAPRPDLILLDPHVAGRDGEEILAELSDHPELRPIPVLVFTSSESAEEVVRSYDLNANAYLEKPATADEFARVASAVENFWLTLAHLPPK